MVDARLPDGSRVNAIIPPLALRGSVLTIRKFSETPYTAKDLVNFGTFSLDFVHLMEACVRGKLNVLVSGGTGTGKTTLLNVLSSFIPERERILTIEDAAELKLQQQHVVSLEARPANAEGKGEVRIRELVRNSLRMRPDRIVVGEVRGAEALDMLQAMNTGHEGSLTTIHANTPRDALSRLETMVLMAGYDLPVRAIREQIASALNVIVQLERMTDGSRKVTSVQEIQGMEGDTILLQEVFRFRPQLTAEGKQMGQMESTGLRPKFLEKLKAHGVEVPAKILQASAALRAERARGSAPAGRGGMLMRGRR
jgi:pilus assembly protein CpaF